MVADGRKWLVAVVRILPEPKESEPLVVQGAIFTAVSSSVPVAPDCSIFPLTSRTGPRAREISRL